VVKKKLLITALRLSQLPLLLSSSELLNSTEGAGAAQISNHANATPVVLLDDITAELDDRAIDILLSTLAQLPCQVIMTSLTADVLPLIDKYWSTSNVFHVKHGVLSPY